MVSGSQFHCKLATILYLVLFDIIEIQYKSAYTMTFSDSICEQKRMEVNEVRVNLLTLSIPRMPKSWLWYSAARLGSTPSIIYSITAVAITEGT
jgi:hypothetical protein